MVPNFPNHQPVGVINHVIHHNRRFPIHGGTPESSSRHERPQLSIEATCRWRLGIPYFKTAPIWFRYWFDCDSLSLYIYMHIYIYNIYLHCVYIYIYGTTPKNDVFEVATLLGQITLFSLSSSGGYHIYIYVYIYTHVCINCCLTVESRYLEQFCHQKRLQTFANETGSGFKI